MYLAIITPTASLGYLVLFLYMQPSAWRLFKGWFVTLPPNQLSEKDLMVIANPVLTKKQVELSEGDAKRMSTRSDAASVSRASAMSARGGVPRFSTASAVSVSMHREGREDHNRGSMDDSLYPEEEEEEDDRTSIAVPVPHYYANPDRLSFNMERYSAHQLNMRNITDEELMDLIDHGNGII